MAISIILKYGTGDIGCEIGNCSNIREIRPKPLPPVNDLNREMVNALRYPIGSEPLNDLALKAQKIVIVVSDGTRPVPTGLLLPLLSRELRKAGIGAGRITVVIGCGSHRPVTDEEKKEILGPLYGKVKCFHSRETGYLLLGITKRGTPVEVSVPVAEADLVVALGNIEMHQMAGFTGGAKAVAAGTASIRALEHNHRLSNLQDEIMGTLNGNIVRNDMEEFARLAGLKFIINVVMDESDRVVQLVAGDPVRAHRAGCMTARRMYGISLSEKYDIIIVSPGGTPKDDTVYQAQKSINNALKGLADNGIIIVTAKCPEGYGNPAFEQLMEQVSGPEEILAKLGQRFALGAHKGGFVARAVKKAGVFLVSDMEPVKVRKLYFEPFGSLQEAVNRAIQIKGTKASVMVMPAGGLTVPFFIN